MTALEKARVAKAAADEARAHRDGEAVLRWKQFVRDEAAAKRAVDAGELEREAWAALWANAPEPPSRAQYDNARRRGYLPAAA